MTVGWRSPVGGPRYDGPVPGREDPQVDEWREEQIQSEIEERRRAEAVAGPEPEDDGLRADGGDNAHAGAVNQTLTDGADDGVENPPLNIGDHVTDEVDEDRDATMVVVGLPSVRATACELDKDAALTVADVNPERLAEDRVVEVAFCDPTDRDLDETKRYLFPRGRLALETPIHGDGGDE